MERLETYIEQKLEGCELGQVFTTEVEIASVFGISRPTARKYVDVLCERGLIERVPGKGIVPASFGKVPSKHETKNYMILVSFTGTNDGYFSEVVKGISDVLNARGDRYRIFMNVKYNDRLEFLKSTDLSEYDGAFISLYEDEDSYKIVDLLHENGVEVILLDNQLDFYNLNCVKNDDVNSGFMLGKYLKENELDPFFLLLGKRRNSVNFERNGFQIDKSLRDRIRGVQYGMGLIETPFPSESFLLLTDFDSILKAAEKRVAFVFYDASVVYRVWSHIKEKNERLLENITFCAFGNSLLTNDFANGVYIKFNGYEIGRAAAELSAQSKYGISITEDIKATLVTNIGKTDKK